MKLNIFFRLEKAWVGTRWKLVSSLNYVFCFGENLNLHYVKQNENLHMQLSIEYGKESVKIFCWWKKYEKKMADFTNHGGFTLRCLAEDLVPVSVHLKQNIKTPKGLQIIRKAERALLNERVRSINNTLNMLKSQRDTCIDWLERVL